MLKNPDLHSRKAVALGVAVACLSGGLLATATASHAATPGTYTSYTLARDIYTVRLYQDSATFTAPTTAPSSSTITTINAGWNFANRPYADAMFVYLCADAANTKCFRVTNPNGSNVSAATMTGIAAFQGFPISTQFHWRTFVDDGQTSSVHAAINPYMYAANTATQKLNYVTVNYSY